MDDNKDMKIEGDTSERRRNASTSPYGYQRNQPTDYDYRKKYLTDKYLELGKQDSGSNRYKSPLDDLYKKHNSQS